MANSDLAALVTAKSEALEVEYKSWTDTTVAEASARLARHLAALSNHGGGYLIFGVDDKTRVPQGATTLDPKLLARIGFLRLLSGISIRDSSVGSSGRNPAVSLTRW
jgi:predicted HTH transcriptional regulator